jgi:hypothetical protein
MLFQMSTRWLLRSETNSLPPPSQTQGSVMLVALILPPEFAVLVVKFGCPNTTSAG